MDNLNEDTYSGKLLLRIAEENGGLENMDFERFLILGLAELMAEVDKLKEELDNLKK